MKKHNNIFFLILLVPFFISNYFLIDGFITYKKAITNKPIADLVSDVKNKNTYLSLESIPKMHINSVIAIEDHRFFKHHGIDIIAIFRALKHDFAAKDFIEGGSTITQQVAKNNYFTQEKTIKRKIAEIFMALKLESSLEKQQILELYLNTSYFGSNYYTIKEASIGYFAKEPKDMKDSQSIMLAGILNAPSTYNPNKNQFLAKKRGIQVLKKLIKYNYLTKSEAEVILEDFKN